MNLAAWLITAGLVAYGTITGALIHRAYRIDRGEDLFTHTERRLIQRYLRLGRKGFRVLPSRETTMKRYRRHAK